MKRLLLSMLACGCGLTLDSRAADGGSDAGALPERDAGAAVARDSGSNVVDARAADGGACIGDPDCDDTIRCTLDRCLGGQCVHEPMPCDADDNTCTIDTCDPVADCVSTGTVVGCAMLGECGIRGCVPGMGCALVGFMACLGGAICGGDGMCHLPTADCNGPEDCDDGFACNGREGCERSACTPGTGCAVTTPCLTAYCTSDSLDGICATVPTPGCTP